MSTGMSSEDQQQNLSAQERSGSPASDHKGKGPEAIGRYLKTLTTAPGVYRMIDGNGDVIYVGKAKNLKNRVQSYARLSGHTVRIQRMIASTVSMEFVSTASESEALLLEANLIKRLKPRYNVLMRDDKSFPYIMISKEHEAPRLLKHRGARKADNDYYGPFASAGAVNMTINVLQKAFLLRTCTDSVYQSRTRPCLLYQIKRCAGPCTGEISLSDYGQLVLDTNEFMSGRSDAVRKRIVEQMEAASSAMDFEQAAIYRDRLQALSHIQASQGINPKSVKDADVFALFQQGGQRCIQTFFFRNGQNWGNRSYFPRADKSIPDGEVLGSFIAQFYDNRPSPRSVFLNIGVPDQKLLAEALSVRAGFKIDVLVPQRGEKRKLVEHAFVNAREALGRRLAESATQRKLLDALGTCLGMEDSPNRIEVYDNSHIQGEHAVGAMIVAGPEGFLKKHYRKFNIKSEKVEKGDDYGMMKEVLHRRFSRLIKAAVETGEKEAPDRSDDPEEIDKTSSFESWPDLLLIDGGAGHLSAARETLEELGLSSIRAVAVAKGPDRDAGREHIHVDANKSFLLESRDPVLYFIQRLRDEAHRFAIGSHRARRKKALTKNPLDDISGIGPKRKRALLQHFGSTKAIARAGVEDLLSVEGISREFAKRIHAYFTQAN